jgi:putative addiction module CopG family antidote
MAITLNPELDRRVQEKLATGNYESVDHVLSAALRALDHEEQTIAAIAEGYEDIQAGRFESWDAADAEFRKKHGLPERK